MSTEKSIGWTSFGAVHLLSLFMMLTTLDAASALTATTQLVSRASTSTTANAASFSIDTSADGRWILFDSEASNVVDGVIDGNGQQDVFLFDSESGQTTLVSRQSGVVAASANGFSKGNAISDDGRWIAFASHATNVVEGVTDTNGTFDAFLYDRVTATTTLVSHAFDSTTTTQDRQSLINALSADGRWLLMQSSGRNVIGGLNDPSNTDVFLIDRVGQTTMLVSRALGSATTTPNFDSYGSRISPDGRWSLFQSNATNLISGVVDDNHQYDLFLFDRDTQTTQLVTRSFDSAMRTANEGHFGSGGISADGRWVFYNSTATNVVSNGVSGPWAIANAYLFDRTDASTTLLSRALGSANTTANAWSSVTAVTDDGRFAFLTSSATNLIAGLSDTNGDDDVFVFDRETQSTVLISGFRGSAVLTANGASRGSFQSGDGRWLLLNTRATNLASGVTDSNGVSDIYVYDRAMTTFTLLSHVQGTPATALNNESWARGISSDGRRILFDSKATNVSSGLADTNNAQDAFFARTFLEATQTTIVSALPDPSVVGIVTSIEVAVVGANTRPNSGTMTITASTGESCVDANGPTIGPALTALYSCAITFGSAGGRDLTATFSASSTHEGSVSVSDPHLVATTPEVSIDDVVEVEGGNGNREFQFAITRSHTLTDVSVRVDTQSGTAISGEDFVAIANRTVIFAAGGSATANVVVKIIGDMVQEPDQTFTVLLSDSANAVISDGSGTGTITNDDTVSLTPAALADAQAGMVYEQSFAAANGLPSYSFALASGALPTGLSFSNEGLLSGTPTAAGSFGFSITAADGTTIGNGGPFTVTNAYMLNVIPGADLQITKDNGRDGLLDGETTVYAIVVGNAGPSAVVGANVTDDLPSTLINGSWMCVPALSTAACPLPAAGNGSLSAMIDLGVNQYLRFDVIADVDGSVGAFVSNTAAVAPPAGVTELDTSSNSAIDQDPIVPIGLFIDGFEVVPAQVLTVPAAARASMH